MIGYVHPDEAIRDAAGGVEERLDQWRSGLARRDELAAAIRAYASTEEARSSRALGDGRSSCGCATSGAADTSWSRSQGRVRAAPRSCLRARRCVRAEPGRVVRRTVVLGPGDLDGLSDSFVAQLPEGEAPGTRRPTMTYSVVFPFVEQSPRRDLREAALKKYYSAMCGDQPPADRRDRHDPAPPRGDRRRRLVEPVRERSADVRRPGRRMAFLEGLTGPLQGLAAQERALDAPDRRPRRPAQVWDWLYYHERQRRELGVDVAEPGLLPALETVLDGVSGILAEVFGVVIRAVPDAPVWHPEVLVYDSTTSNRELLADVYLDLFARDGKRPGGWQTPLELPVNEPAHRAGRR